MTIKYKSITFKPYRNYKRFDIIKDDKIMAYDVHIANFYGVIVKMGIADRDEVADLVKYIREYKKIQDEILNMFKL